MHACMYVCMYACIMRVLRMLCAYVFGCTYACIMRVVCMHVWLHVCWYYTCLYVCMCVCVSVLMHACVHVCMYARVYVCMHECMHAWCIRLTVLMCFVVFEFCCCDLPQLPTPLWVLFCHGCTSYACMLTCSTVCIRIMYVLSCDIHTHTPARKSYTHFILYPFVSSIDIQTGIGMGISMNGTANV